MELRKSDGIFVVLEWSLRGKLKSLEVLGGSRRSIIIKLGQSWLENEDCSIAGMQSRGATRILSLTSVPESDRNWVVKRMPSRGVFCFI